MRRLLLALVFVFAFAGVAAADLHFPALTGRVVDQAGVLSPQTRQYLDQMLVASEQKTGDQLVVVTLSSLDGTSIEDYGVQLGRNWGIGQQGKNNGVLLIVAPQDRKVRIEVGYGLESVVTDAVAKLIIENKILPPFRAGHIDQGIVAGTQSIIDVLGGDASVAQQYASNEVQPQPLTANNKMVLIGILVFLAILLLISFCMPGNFLLNFLTLLFDIVLMSGGRSGGSGGGGFSGGGGSFGGGGASGSW